MIIEKPKNALAARRAEPEYIPVDPQSVCDRRNAESLTYLKDWYWFVKTSRKANGDLAHTVERMDLPTGSKRWMKDNEAMVRGLIRKITGGNPDLIDAIYHRAVQVAPSPVAWDNRA